MMRRFKNPFSLRILLLIINLIVLAIPIFGLLTLRVFENLIHRQTEEKLLSEGAFIQALYISTIGEIANETGLDESAYRVIGNASAPSSKIIWKPYLPQIDILRDPVLPKPPDGKVFAGAVNPSALEAGRRIEPIIKQAQLQNMSAVRVLDPNGVVIASTRSEIGLDLSHRYEVQGALAGRYTAALRERISEDPPPPIGSISRASRIRVFAAIPIIDAGKLYGVVYLSRTSLSVSRVLLNRRIAAALAIMLAVTILISLGLSYIVAGPMKNMVRQAARVAAGEPGVSLEANASAPKEAHQLSRSLSQMLEKLQQRLEYVKEFSSSVSHEFKTPLTGIQGAIEILKDNWKDMTEADRERFLNIIDSESRRMDRLVRRLIELTKIETAAPSGETTDLDNILEMTIHRYVEAGHDVGLIKNVEIVRANIPSDMAEILFVNLIENAVTHGRGSPVSVILDSGPILTVSNGGPGISSANIDRIFERFFTTSRASGGTGLGLSMVKAIAKSCGAKIEVESNEKETVFRVVFKPSS